MEIILTIFLNFGIHSEKAEVKEYSKTLLERINPLETKADS